MSSSPRIATIIDVAALAKVSTATVSRVLSGRRSKDDEIDRRVRQAANDLRYHVNDAASALRGESTNTWEMAMADPTDGFSCSLLPNVIAVASSCGKRVLTTLLDDSGHARRDDSSIQRRSHPYGIEGRILLPASCPSSQPPLNSSIVDIVVSPHAINADLPCVFIDQNSTMDIAVTHLASHGAHRTAFLGAAPNFGSSNPLRDASYLIAFEESTHVVNQTTRPEWVLLGPRTAARGYADALRLMTRTSDAPDSLICVDAQVASGARLALDSLHDISTPIVAIDDHPTHAGIDERIALLRPDFMAMATAMATALTSLARKDSPERVHVPQRHAVPMSFVSGLVQAS
ncbi:LacI family DNA-binding transcriptional regulator [uncultured Bifidobacterium sp.]|uniref:LacI family DNA-binding transcriptional regulator n=1 Tax=uncultured Bifidobacterium sp. TaxID=165187 RepID=UPI0026128D58|nr:LacI family DNA-binding transcriptional regulator [uncultured Bifidobacterium sp.]